MSYDLAVFFASEEFPAEPWLSLVTEIGETFDQIQAVDDPSSGLRQWRTVVDDSSVYATLYTLQKPELYDVPEAFRWRLGVYANSGCSPAARWAQFSIPYRCLSFLACTIAYDPQSGTVFDSPDEYWDFASTAITRWSDLPGQLRRLSLLTDDGVLAIDRPPSPDAPQSSLRESP